MPGTIPRKFIEDLLTRIDIVDVIGHRINLKKDGSNFKACCPFHTEKTPSFKVNGNKQFYYCFGCGAHGDAIEFLKNYEHMEFMDAIEALAAHAGIPVPKTINAAHNATVNEHESLLTEISNYYQQQLYKSNAAIQYLKSRSLNSKICKLYNIGFAPPEWNNLPAKFAANSFRQQLQINGILIVKNNNHYARFRNRIMFPIKNHRGQIIAFGGRTIGDDTPKYLNSPETPIFHKGSEVYGLYEARCNRSLTEFIVVEGYMDVVVLAQHGINNAVATLGTAISKQHIQKLLRYANKLIFCFDGDAAGHAAAWRALENSLPLMRDNIQILFVFLPQGEDPDSLVRKEGKQNFTERLMAAMPLSEFFFNHLSNNLNLVSIDGKAQLTHKVLALLKDLPLGIFRNLMLEKLSQITNTSIENLANLSNKVPNNIKKSRSIEPPPLLCRAIKILLHHPELALAIKHPQEIAKLNIPYAKLLSELLALLAKQSNITAGALLAHWRNQEEAQLIASLVAEQPIISPESLKNEFVATINKLYDLEKEQVIQQLIDKASQGIITSDEKRKLQQLISNKNSKTNEG